MDKQNYQSPAFPPQIAQDHLGRVLAPIPGLTKLEYFAVQLLPTFMNLAATKGKLMAAGKLVSPTEAAVEMAKELLDVLTKTNENEKENNSVGSIIK